MPTATIRSITLKRLAVALSIAFALSACGGGSDASSAKSDVFEFEYQGATGTLDLTESSDVLADEKVTAASDAVAQGSSPLLHCVLADVDNTDGTEYLNMYSLEIVTADGDTLIALDFQNDVLGSDDGSYSDPTDAVDAMESNLSPGAKDTAVFAFSEPIESVSRVYIYPAGGMDRVEAKRKG